MAIIRITGQGLAAIALSVAALWGCFLAEQITMRNARRERAQVMVELYRLQRRQNAPQPASSPVPRIPHPSRPAQG